MFGFGFLEAFLRISSGTFYAATHAMIAVQSSARPMQSSLSSGGPTVAGVKTVWTALLNTRNDRLRKADDAWQHACTLPSCPARKCMRSAATCAVAREVRARRPEERSTSNP